MVNCLKLPYPQRNMLFMIHLHPYQSDKFLIIECVHPSERGILNSEVNSQLKQLVQVSILIPRNVSIVDHVTSSTNPEIRAIPCTNL